MNIQNSWPTLDIHGETRKSIVFLVNDFINDNYKMGKLELIIIHGIGEGILRNELHKLLKTNKKVILFKLDMFNLGCTKIKLNCKVDKSC